MDINLMSQYELLDTVAVIIGEIDCQIEAAEKEYRRAKTEEEQKAKEKEIEKLQTHRRQKFEQYKNLEKEIQRYLGY